MPELQKLRPSLDVAKDGVAMRARLKEDGYLYFPGYLDRDALIDLRRDMMKIIAQHGWIAEETDPFQGIPSQPVRHHGMEQRALLEQLTAEGRKKPSDPDEIKELLSKVYEKYKGEGWRDGYIAIQRLESFHRQAHDPRILDLLTTLFDDDDILVHGQRIARVVWPSEEKITTSPHQDFTHIQGTADVITAWIPLSDCPPDLGGLRYLLGSHKPGKIWEYESSSDESPIPRLKDVDDTDSAWATADWKLGDLVLHHSFMVHAALPNTSQRLRVSLDYRYQRAEDPVAVNSLRPHNCPYVPDWPELLDGVSWNSFEWVDRERHPENFTATEVTGEYFQSTEKENLADFHPPTRLLQSVE